VTWEPLPGDAHDTHELASVIERLHHTLGLARPDSVTTIQQHWTSLLGKDLAPSCRLEALHHETMVVAVEDPAIAEHLRWSASELLGAVNALCGGEVASELQVRVRRQKG